MPQNFHCFLPMLTLSVRNKHQKYIWERIHAWFCWIKVINLCIGSCLSSCKYGHALFFSFYLSLVHLLTTFSHFSQKYTLTGLRVLHFPTISDGLVAHLTPMSLHCIIFPQFKITILIYWLEWIHLKVHCSIWHHPLGSDFHSFIPWNKAVS